MNFFQRLSVSGFLLMAVFSGQTMARPQQAEQHLRSGFALAQTCEKEIDDDLTFYGECIGHAMDRVAGQRQVLLGLHFQAWLMADLAARQNSTRSIELRKRHAQGMQRQLRASGMTLDQLCQAKKIVCETVRERMAQRL